MQTGIGGNVAVWDMKNGNKLVTLDAHNLSVSEIVFSPDGRLLLTTGQDSQVRGVPSNWMAEFSVKLWDVSAWKTKLTVSFVRNGAPSAAFSPDGRKMALQKAWDQVQVLDVDTGVVLESLQARDPNPNYHQFARANIIFSWDGKLLLQGAQDGVRVWKLREP